MGVGFLTFKGTAQIATADEAYEQLDVFLGNPSQSSMTSFLNEIETWNPQTKEGQMAKVVSYCNLGYYQRQYVLFFDAIRSYEQAKQLYQEHSLEGYDMIEFCYKPLGNLYTQTNALEEAEHTIKEYILQTQEEGRVEEEAAGLLNLSVVFQSKGNYRQAIQVLEQGTQLTPNNKDFQLNLANNYLSLGDIDTSEKLIGPMLEKDDCKVLQLWASIQLKKDAPESAIQALQRCWDLNQTYQMLSVRELAKLSLAMAQTQWVLGNAEESKINLYKLYTILIPNFSIQTEFPMQKQLFSDNTLIDALDLHAKILGSEQQWESAYEAYVRAFQVEELLDDPSVLQETKLLQQTRNKVRSENCMKLLFELYKNGKDTRWLEKAFAIDQQSKSPVLREARQWQESLLEKEDPLYQSLRTVKKELALLKVQMEQMRKSQVLHPQLFHELQVSYNEALLKQRSLYESINDRYPNKNRGKEVSLSNAISHCKQHGVTMVSYFFGKEHIYQFIISGSEVVLYRLTENKKDIIDILQYINDYTIYFENPSGIANNPLGFVVSSHILYRELRLPTDEHLVVIPDGILAFVPFAALITQETQTTDFSEMPFLIKQSQTTYVLSVSDYMNSTTLKEKPTLLGVFPVFANTPKALTYSVEEANGVEKYMKASLLMGSEATSGSFLEQSSQYDILHVSTHARGGTFTNPAAIEFIDRTMTLDELYGYEFDKELVVLSACETGVGKVIKGEGVQNMARAFQYTGTDHVLFSLWNVNDYSTSQIMKGFYKEFRKRGMKSASLRDAQLDYLSETNLDNTKKSPYYWAAFVYYGTTEVPQTYSNVLYIYGILGLLLLVVLFLFMRKRKVALAKGKTNENP